jgi:hypothetical protein
MHREAKRFETEIANDLSGRRVFLSGAGMEKADVRRHRGFRRKRGAIEQTNTFAFRVEAKTTKAETFVFTTRDWADLVRVADAAGETPIFCVKFVRRFMPAALALLRESLVVELELLPSLSMAVPAHVLGKTRRLKPTSFHERLRIEDLGARGALAVVRYHDLVERIRGHENFG